jgi:hypothetical protein
LIAGSRIRVAQIIASGVKEVHTSIARGSVRGDLIEDTISIGRHDKLILNKII